MQHFDSDYGSNIITRISHILEDRRPRWGTMTRNDLLAHFIWILRHAMGRSTRIPDCSTWRLRTLVKPLVLRGLLPMPRNMHLPPQLTANGLTLLESGDIETLQAIIEEYLQLVQADELDPAPHPFFGPLDVDEWDKLHVRHFEYHLRQFDV